MLLLHDPDNESRSPRVCARTYSKRIVICCRPCGFGKSRDTNEQHYLHLFARHEIYGFLRLGFATAPSFQALEQRQPLTTKINDNLGAHSRAFQAVQGRSEGFSLLQPQACMHFTQHRTRGILNTKIFRLGSDQRLPM